MSEVVFQLLRLDDRILGCVAYPSILAAVLPFLCSVPLFFSLCVCVCTGFGFGSFCCLKSVLAFFFLHSLEFYTLGHRFPCCSLFLLSPLPSEVSNNLDKKKPPEVPRERRRPGTHPGANVRMCVYSISILKPNCT